jgi:hypothetical protein
MRQQQKGLDELKGNLEQLDSALPGTSRTIASLLNGLRWLLWVLAAGLVFHAVVLLLTPRSAKAPTA